MTLLIKNGRILDPANGTDRVGDILIQGSKIVAAFDDKAGKQTVIDAAGKWVVPGLIDLHVHAREPGFEYKETIATACEAAAAGGFTTIVTMPNTDPTCDRAAIVEAIYERAGRANGVTVYPMGAITKKLAGEELAEFGDMQKAGAVAVTDDGHGVMNAAIMRAALEYAQNFGLVVCAHCEDKHLAGQGLMHEGEMSSKLGMRAIPAAAESIIVARDIQLCEHTGGRYHVQHISTKASIDLVRQAKKNGLAVTCEVAPHHWALSDEALAGYNSNFKVNPPLRSAEHIRAIRRGLKDGTIDAIATDHAPHAEIDKKVEFDQAANGIIGLETALPLSLALWREGHIELHDLLAKLTCNPARILSLPKGNLSVGADADVTIIDPERSWTYDAAQVRSKSRNSPWLGKTFTGRAIVTIARGKIVHQL